MILNNGIVASIYKIFLWFQIFQRYILLCIEIQNIVNSIIIRNKFKNMLESKIKIKKQTIIIYDILSSEQTASSQLKIAQIQQRKLFKETINIIYAILINFSAPIDKKLNALTLLKKLFQTAHQDVILEAEKILPVLMEIAISSKQQAEPGTLYFVLRQLRPVDEVEKGRKYVRFAMEILKQWAQYMMDVRQDSSIYIRNFKTCEQQKVVFPQYFLYFTMRDYVQFMLNWMKRKRKDQLFRDKVQIFFFLTNPDAYSKGLSFYRNNLSENAGLIVYETISILINHTIPVQSKIQVLQSMKDLYQQGNLIYSSKIQELVVPYFEYFVDLFKNNNLPAERYFQIIQRRLGIDLSHSRQYVFTILQLIKQWNQYNIRSSLNPFMDIWSKIQKKGLLNGVNKFIFQANDINRYMENVHIGKHRQPEYIIPPNKSLNNLQAKYLEQIKQYQRRLNEQSQRQRAYEAQILALKQKLEENPRILQQIIEPLRVVIPQNQSFPNQTEEKQQNNPRILQQIRDPLLLAIPKNQPVKTNVQNQIPKSEVISYVKMSSYTKIRDQDLDTRQKQLFLQVSKHRTLSREPYQNQKTNSTLTKNVSAKRFTEYRTKPQNFDVSKIHKLSDAMKYKQIKQSRSRLSRY